MRNYLSLSCVPCAEDCVQVGSPNYEQISSIECKIYKEQLERQFNISNAPVRLTVKTFPHDFGSYKEVCVIFDDENEQACEIAYDMENNLPENWDEIARKQINSLMEIQK